LIIKILSELQNCQKKSINGNIWKFIMIFKEAGLESHFQYLISPRYIANDEKWKKIDI